MFNWRISWKEEPYRSAKCLAGSKAIALELIELIGQVKEIGPGRDFITEYYG